MVPQLLCNGNYTCSFNEMGSSFRKVFPTNMAVSIPFTLAMVHLTISTKEVPDHVTFGLALTKSRSFLTVVWQLLGLGQCASITTSKSLNASRVSLCLITNHCNNAAIDVMVIDMKNSDSRLKSCKLFYSAK